MEMYTHGINKELAKSLDLAGWFNDPGVYVLVDGQFGSTGKGLLSAVLGEYGHDKIDLVTSNAGPNSGHTAYCPINKKKIMTQQIPVSSVIANRIKSAQRKVDCISTYLNGGAIIDLDILLKECQDHQISPIIHPSAAMISPEHVDMENMGGPSKVATTAKGVGAALASKVMRENKGVPADMHYTISREMIRAANEIVFIETSQGFSLGYHSGFYPHCTSRECSVSQALADAQISPKNLRKVAACYRTFPIRVGNTSVGYSGDCYSDQVETTWEDIGVEPELTTVTKRVRRVFTWSWQQFIESLIVNSPDLVFINFLQYLKPAERQDFLEMVREVYFDTLKKPIETLLVGYGMLNSDVYIYEKGRIWSGSGIIKDGSLP